MIIRRVGGKPERLVRAAGAKVLDQLGREAVRQIRRMIGKGSPSAPGDPPASVTGRLRKSTTYQVTNNGTKLRIGFKEPYGAILDAGTKSPILPVRARALALRLNDGTTIFRAFIRGTKKRPVIDKALKAAFKQLKIRLLTSNAGNPVTRRL